MKDKALFALVGVTGIIGATFLVTQASSAHGLFGLGGEKGLEQKAEILGLEAEELRSKLESQSLPEILEDQGLTDEDFRAQMEEQHRERLNEMGLSEEEIDERTQAHQERHEEMLSRKAEVLGLSTDELKTQLEEKSFTEILEAQGLTLEEFHDKMADAGYGCKGHGGFGKGFGVRGPPEEEVDASATQAIIN
ncbi:MAG: hypothetical protein Q8Q20_01190 [bacterium]|nr:hypothetical protein [bacterium]